MRFHLVHAIPDHRMHGLHGYREAIETVQWGLQQMGHQCTAAMNVIKPGETNIIFGAQMLPDAGMDALPSNTIVYNFEQLRNARQSDLKPSLQRCAERLRIWDYSEFNLPFWTTLGTKYPVLNVPIGHAPILERIAKPAEQPIDLLFYGTPAPSRMAWFEILAKTGASFAFLCGLYGEDRDDLIGKSKVVLNINWVDHSNIFEVPRVAYLLSNRKAVVALEKPGLAAEEDFRRGVCFSAPDAFKADCLRLIESPSERAALEEAGYAVMASRDIRAILGAALGTL